MTKSAERSRHPSALPGEYYGIELCSGHGTVARTAEKVLGIKFFTVDNSTKFGKPDLLLDILDTHRVVTEIQQLADDNDCSVCAAAWVSVPCQAYSQMNTTGSKDPSALLAADHLVEAAQVICQALQVKVMIIENPGTGKLAGREVINFIPASQVYDLDYCAYGTTYKKNTRLWSTRNLGAAGFKPKRCSNYKQGGQMLCDATFRHPWTGRIRHCTSWAELRPAQRVAVPDRLVIQVFQPVRRLLLTELTAATSAAVPAVANRVAAAAAPPPPPGAATAKTAATAAATTATAAAALALDSPIDELPWAAAGGMQISSSTNSSLIAVISNGTRGAVAASPQAVAARLLAMRSRRGLTREEVSREAANGIEIGTRTSSTAKAVISHGTHAVVAASPQAAAAAKLLAYGMHSRLHQSPVHPPQQQQHRNQ